MIISLSATVTILLDIAAWSIISVGLAYLLTGVPSSSFDPESWLFRYRTWENRGKIYTRLFRVRLWKEKLPDGAVVFKGGFAKKRLEMMDEGYLQRFVEETCRSELYHWIVFLFGPLFFIWNVWWVGIVMIFYATVANIPCIVVQRYNRIRLQRLTRRYG